MCKREKNVAWIWHHIHHLTACVKNDSMKTNCHKQWLHDKLTTATYTVSEGSQWWQHYIQQFSVWLHVYTGFTSLAKH